MTYYLFTWVPEYYNDLLGAYEVWREEGSVEVRNWAVARKAIPSGSPLFVMRQGNEPRGIIARGRTTSETRTPREDGNAHANDVVIEEFADTNEPPVRLDQLLRIREKRGLWDARQGGIIIPADTAEKLENAWREAWTARQRRPSGVGRT